MPTETDPEEIPRLYAALNKRILANDKEGTIETYYELLNAGRPLSEILALTGEASPISVDTENRQPSPVPLHARDARSGFRRIATARLSPMLAAITMLAVSVIVAAASIGVWLISPAVQKVALGGPTTSEAVVAARSETSSTAAASAAPSATVEAVNATATGGLSPIVPEPALTSPTVATVTVLPPAEPVRSARLAPEAPEREMVGAVAVPPPAGPVPAALPAPASPILDAPTVVTARTPKILPDQSRPVAAEIAALLARGDSLLGVGDIASARLLYERAADAGDGRGALRLGATYDPGFLGLLNRVHLPQAHGDAAQALSWYRRASDLGESEAERWIEGLETKSGR